MVECLWVPGMEYDFNGHLRISNNLFQFDLILTWAECFFFIYIFFFISFITCLKDSEMEITEKCAKNYTSKVSDAFVFPHRILNIFFYVIRLHNQFQYITHTNSRKTKANGLARIWFNCCCFFNEYYYSITNTGSYFCARNSRKWKWRKWNALYA